MNLESVKINQRAKYDLGQRSFSYYPDTHTPSALPGPLNWSLINQLTFSQYRNQIAAGYESQLKEAVPNTSGSDLYPTLRHNVVSTCCDVWLKIRLCRALLSTLRNLRPSVWRLALQ